MRIDAHQHFWHYRPERDTWITDEMVRIQRDFMPPDLAPLLQAAGFDGTIAVQAGSSEAETRFLLDLADRHDFIKGVVGWVDLRADDVGARLDRWSRQDRLCGVRHVVQSEPDDRFMLGPAFRRGIGLLAAHGLTYDILIYPRHLRAAEALVRQFPYQRFVVDHLAKPPIKHHRTDPWMRDLRALARQEHVCCKLSGLVTEADWHGWQPDDFVPYLDAALDAFGPSRLMIGSDWPVCLLAGDYATVMGLVTDYLHRLSADEQDAILGDTAAAFYGVEHGDE